MGSAIVIVGAMLGIGAGFIVVPVLVLIFGLPMHNAITISLVVIVAMSVSVSRLNVRRGFVNVKLASMLELSAVIGAIAGAFFAVKTNPDKLKMIFSIALFLSAVFTVKKFMSKKSRQNLKTKNDVPKELDGRLYDYKNRKIIRYSVENVPIALMGTLLGGLLSGLMGIGGGILNVPVLNLLCKMPIKAAGATSNYMLAVTACAGATIYILKGYLLTSFALPLILGVVMASSLGVKIFQNIKSKYIEILLAVILTFTALKMLIQ